MVISQDGAHGISAGSYSGLTPACNEDGVTSVRETAPIEGAIKGVRQVLEQVADPEIPVLTIADLGILRDVRWDDGRIQAVITPTYSGCPAMQTIEQDIRTILRENGYAEVEVKTQISPPWTTDWLSAAGREKLLQYGIVPPAGSTAKQSLRAAASLECPRCRSTNTEKISEFGSTPCKALYKCNDCLEPFDYFKCL